MHRLIPDGATGVVYFDGFCGLCDRFVTFLAARDRTGVLRFAPLQGTTAANRFPVPAAGADDPATVVYEDARGTHTRSTAALRAVMALGGAWRAAAVFLLVPRPLRDALYRWVARHRFGWFGRRDRCRLPAPDEQDRFLP